MNLQQKSSPYYENIEFNLTNGTSDYDLDVEQATFLAVLGSGNEQPFPTYLEIRTNQTISVKLNSTSGHKITIASTDSPYVIVGVKIINLYLSNASGSTAAVKIRLQNTPY